MGNGGTFKYTECLRISATMKLSATTTRDSTESDQKSHTDIRRVEIIFGGVGISESQHEALETLESNCKLTDSGRVDFGLAERYYDGSPKTIKYSFGRHGRNVRYTDKVDEPDIEMLCDDIRSSDTMEVLNEVEEYASIGRDGRINTESIYEKVSELDGVDIDETTLDAYIGRRCLVLLPWSEYVPDSEAEMGIAFKSGSVDIDGGKATTQTEEEDTKGYREYKPRPLSDYDRCILDIARLRLSGDDIPANQYQALVMGWKLHEKLESVDIQQD